MFEQFLVHSWYSDAKWLFIFKPFSWIYQLILFLRAQLYQRGILHIHHLPVPVIVVGNLTVGGTGKTPLVIALVDFFKDQGFTPGVITRGYGGKIKSSPVLVSENSTVEQVGDEAKLIFMRTHCPVMVSKNRVLAAKSLLKNTQCDVIISDDGLQHTALGRDVEVIVIDGERRFGNEKCLPEGPLRESIDRLNQVDMIVCNGLQSNENEYPMQLEVESVYNLKHPYKEIELLSLIQPVIAVTGIGNPERFFKTLDEYQLEIEPKIFPDHHKFIPNDLIFNKNNPIIMTEKDAVKCKAFAQSHHWVLKVNAILEEKFYSTLLWKAQYSSPLRGEVPEGRRGEVQPLPHKKF